MKNYKILAAAVAMVAMLSACKDDIQMTTAILEDGSCARMIACHVADTVKFAQTDSLPHLHGLLSNGWQYEKEMKNDSAFYTFAKKFDDVEQMSNSLPLHVNGIPVQAVSGFRKSYNWFNVEYHFYESFALAENPFAIAYNDYLSTPEMSYWCIGTPELFAGLSGVQQKEALDKIESKFGLWVNANLAYDLVSSVIACYESAPIALPAKDTLQARQLDFVRYVSGKGPGKVFGKTIGLGDTELLNEAFSTYFLPEMEAAVMKRMYDGEWLALQDNFNERMNIYQSLSSLDVKYQLVMPGELTQQVGPVSVNGNVATFWLTGYNLLYDYYVIETTSHKSNPWAYGLLVVICLIALGSIVYVRKR